MIRRYGLLVLVAAMALTLAACPKGNKEEGKVPPQKPTDNATHDGGTTHPITQPGPKEPSRDVPSVGFAQAYEAAKRSPGDEGLIKEAALAATKDDRSDLVATVQDADSKRSEAERLLAVEVLAAVPNIETMPEVAAGLEPVILDRSKNVRVAVARFLNTKFGMAGSSYQLAQVVIGLAGDRVADKDKALDAILREPALYAFKAQAALLDELAVPDEAFHVKLLRAMVTVGVDSELIKRDLVDLCKSAKMSEKRDAIELLARYAFKVTSAVNDLQNMYKSAGVPDRRQMIEVLADLTSVRDDAKRLAVNVFNVNMLKSEDDRDLREDIVKALCRAERKEAWEALTDLLNENRPQQGSTTKAKDHPTTIVMAAAGLGNIARRVSIDSLIATMWHSDPSVSNAAFKAIQTRIAMEGLLFIPGSPDSRTQIEKIRARWEQDYNKYADLDKD